MWQQALLFPDDADSWSWAEQALLNLPAFTRILIALKRAGVATVIVCDSRDSTPLQTLVDAHPKPEALPLVAWWSDGDPPEFHSDSPVLAVRGGMLFSPALLGWFSGTLESEATEKGVAVTEEDSPVLASVTSEEVLMQPSAPTSFRGLLRTMAGPFFPVPPEQFCTPVDRLSGPEQDRELLAMVGKITDRPHVRWVRRRSFALIRWLAERRFTPNQVTWFGFLVACLACLLIAGGNYWSGVIGAVLLYASWVLDCVDGTLARLTFAESRFGQQLDTVLGHATNLLIFSALVWAVYGRDSLWKAGAAALFLLGGIALAFRMSEQEKKQRSADGSPPKYQRLTLFLDKINHRDYAVVIFALALVNGFKVFLWLSLVGVQVFWLMHYWLIRKHRARAAEAN